MKKLSFFLMAMLMSVMSFAAEATATISFADKAQRTVYTTNQQVWEQNGIVVTNDKASSTTNVGDYANPARFYKGSKVTIQCTLGNIKKIEITGWGDSKYNVWATSIGSEAAASGSSVIITPTAVSDTYVANMTGGQARAGQMVITYEVADAGFVSTPTIEGEQYFKESATVSMKAAEGLKVYYTLDGTDPTTASTEYTASFEVKETTTVKAIASDGENASDVVTVVFKKMQVLTPSEAAAITPTGDKYIVRGYVTSSNEYSTQYNNIDFFVADTKEGGEVLKVYRAVAVTEEDKAVKVGDYVEVIGELAAYYETIQIAQGGTYTIIPEPAPEPTTETVYFINAKKWAKVNVYAWTTDPIVAWPGAAATKEAEQIAGYDVYSYTLDAGAAANVIFNNGSSQTPDLVWTAGKYYVIDMGWLTKEEAETELAAPLPETWNIVGDAGLMGKGWDLNAAENAMTQQADGTYLLEKKDITITAGTYEYKAAKDHGWDVSVPQDGNQKLTISKSGIYDITFVLNVTAKTLKATTTLKKEAVVIPTVIIAGDMNGWDQNKDKFTMAADSLTATFKATLTAKSYGFKMIVGGAWLSDAKTITRAANSHKFTGANNSDSKLTADIAGEYLFTWEYATKTLTVTYPALPVKYNVTVTAENGTVTGAGTYEEGKEATLTATAAEGYEFVNWTVADSVVSTENPYKFAVTANIALVANFKEVEDPVVELPAANVRAWAYDLALAVEGEQYTFSYKATTDAVATLIFTDANGVELATKELGVVKAGANSKVLAATELPAGSKLNWAIKLEAGAIAELAEVTDQTRGIYDFYNMMDVLVDNNPESEYFGKIYIQMAYNGSDDGATDRADVQTAGLFIYDQALNELNDPSNVGIKPTLPEGYTMGDNRNKFHRLEIDPKTGKLAYCYNVAGSPAVFTIDRANLTGEVENLIAGVEGLNQTCALAFDAEGTLYLMNLANSAGAVYKVVDGKAVAMFEPTGKFVNASMSMATDGMGGVWVAQNRGQIDAYYQLAHVTKDGVLDYTVFNGSNPDNLTGSSTRGALAYDAEYQLLAQGRNGKVEVYSVAYDAETGVPTLTLVASTPYIAGNIDGLHFDYAGDLYVVSSGSEKFYKYALPTANNVCTTPAASKYAIKLVDEYTVKATVNPAETGVIAGLAEGGIYVKGAEATLTATAAEGYEFVNWTVADSVVSTEATYTFVVEANVELVANFKEAAIEYMLIEEEITNLVIDTESMALIGGPSANFQVEIFLGLAEDENMDGKWSLSAESSVAVMGQDVKFLDGYAYDIDVNTPAAKAVLHVQDAMGAYYELQLNMTAAAQEAIVIEIADATVAIDTIPQFGGIVEYALNITANWTYAEDGVTYPVLVEVPVYYPEATEPSEIRCTVTVGGWGDEDPWLGFGEGTLTITTVDGVVTVAGTVNNPGTGFAANVTISGKLPVQQDPETGVDNIQVENTTVKVVEDGQVFIIRNGVKFNANGAVVK